jgi:hypothetical protein
MVCGLTLLVASEGIVTLILSTKRSTRVRRSVFETAEKIVREVDSQQGESPRYLHQSTLSQASGRHDRLFGVGLLL